MDEIEIIMFREISDYNEKFYGLTFRQWIFSVLIALTVIPTYILLPKYTPITQDIASYIVIVEAGIIGFFGFIKINDLSAEHIAPYWYRHFVCFSKPIKYVSDAEWEAAHEKKSKKSNDNVKVVDTTTLPQSKTIPVQARDDNKPSKKQLKQEKKKEKMLAKARAKYGYLLEDEGQDKPSEAKATVNESITEHKTEVLSDTQQTTALETTIIETPDKSEQKKETEDVLSQLSPQQKEALLNALLKNNEQ